METNANRPEVNLVFVISAHTLVYKIRKIYHTLLRRPLSTSEAADPLLGWREYFPILNDTTYLINNSLGAMPRTVYDSLRAYADTWAELGVSAWGHPYHDQPTWWDLNGAVGDRIAGLIGAPAGSVLIQQNASIANSVLFSALDFSDAKRNKVVITDMDFPGDIYVLRRWLPDHIDLHTARTHNGIAADVGVLAQHKETVFMVFRSTAAMKPQIAVNAAMAADSDTLSGQAVKITEFCNRNVVACRKTRRVKKAHATPQPETDPRFCSLPSCEGSSA